MTDVADFVTIRMIPSDYHWSSMATGINYGPIMNANMYGFVNKSGKKVGVYSVLDSGSPYTFIS